MAGRILHDDIEALKRQADLADVISDHTALKRAGSRLKGLCPFHQERTPSFSVDPAQGVFHCLAGETGVLTRDGVRSLGDMAGDFHDLLTTGGTWVTSEVRSFGVQRLHAVHLSRNRVAKTLFATSGHRWFLRRGGRRRQRTTLELRPGDGLDHVFKDRGSLFSSAPSPLGVAHGFTFGDGTANEHEARAYFSTEPDMELLRYFPQGCRIEDRGDGRVMIRRLPLYFKKPPPLDEAPSYLYGWLAGYFAADGCVSTDGQVALASSTREHLEYVRDVATRIGIGTYSVKRQDRVGIGASEPTPVYSLTFICSTLHSDFFLHERHRARYRRAVERGRIERKGWVVRAVEPTDRVEEVFCAVVPGTHAFALEDNILTGNCFGCGEGGDVYTFLMKTEGLTFTEAVEQLARRVGYQLRYEELTAGQRRALGERSQLVSANRAAADWYHSQLLSDAGEPARAYLKERGFGRSEAERFELGFAPQAWDALTRHLRGERFAERDIVAAGLAKRGRRGGLLDLLRGRLVFPVLDPAGDVIGFGGRVVPGLDHGDHDAPKYLNTPETPVYRKQRVLYGLPWARSEVVRRGEVLVCEGYTDVMALHQAGLENAVATCGTAVGQGHIELLQRYAHRVVLAFDSDEAGARAAERAWELTQGRDLEVRVLILPDGQDPADLVRRHGADTVRELVDGAEPVLRFMLRRVASGHPDTPEGRTAAVEAAAPLLARIPEPVLRDQYSRLVADELVGMSLTVVAGAVERAGGELPSVEVRPGDQPSDGDPQARSARARLERELLQVALQRRDLLPPAWAEVDDNDLSHPSAKAVFRALAGAGPQAGELAAVLDAADDDEVRATIRRLALDDFTVEPDEAHVEMLVSRLLLYRLERQIARHKAALERLNPTVEPEEHQRRFEELIALEARRRDLRDRATA